MKSRRPIVDWAFILVAALSIGAAITVLRQEGWTVFREILFDDIWLLGSLLPKVAAGCLIGALVRLLVPRETVVRWVGEGSGIWGLVIASGVGAVFPGGPFTIFPLAGAFMMIGADRGAAVAFVTAWLLLGINRAIIWELPFFGPDFVVQRIAMSWFIPLAAGLLARWADRLIPEPRGET